jgi:uncharacterized protein YegL
MVFDPNAFVLAEARPLPLILLLDTSGSMAGERIAAVNTAIRELGQDLAAAETPQGEVHIVEFNHNVHVRPLTPARQFVHTELVASGTTSMGAAIDRVRQLVEDPQLIPSRAYAPTLVLVSDGHPTDEVDAPLQRLLQSPRARKATRLALAIGEGVDLERLKAFVANPELPLIQAHDVTRIREFFRWVSMSVQVRSKSRNPDQVAVAPLIDFSANDIVY